MPASVYANSQCYDESVLTTSFDVSTAVENVSRYFKLLIYRQGTSEKVQVVVVNNSDKID